MAYLRFFCRNDRLQYLQATVTSHGYYGYLGSRSNSEDSAGIVAELTIIVFCMKRLLCSSNIDSVLKNYAMKVNVCLSYIRC